jgi:hypothetical protein
MSSRDSRAWVAALHGPTALREEASAELHALLLGGARFKLTRRALDHVSSEALDRLAIEAADAALDEVLTGLDGFRGTSHFTTWASKFVLREARVRLRQAPAGRTASDVLRRS